MAVAPNSPVETIPGHVRRSRSTSDAGTPAITASCPERGTRSAAPSTRRTTCHPVPRSPGIALPGDPPRIWLFGKAVAPAGQCPLNVGCDDVLLRVDRGVGNRLRRSRVDSDCRRTKRRPDRDGGVAGAELPEAIDDVREHLLRPLRRMREVLVLAGPCGQLFPGVARVRPSRRDGSGSRTGPRARDSTTVAPSAHRAPRSTERRHRSRRRCRAANRPVRRGRASRHSAHSGAARRARRSRYRRDQRSVALTWSRVARAVSVRRVDEHLLDHRRRSEQIEARDQQVGIGGQPLQDGVGEAAAQIARRRPRRRAPPRSVRAARRDRRRAAPRPWSWSCG